MPDANAPISFKPFHSAVNRIPVLRDEAQKLASQGKLPAELFDDFAPFAHDHLHGERFSGSIDIKMIVRTPLVFGEQHSDEDRNQYVDLPTGGDGNPIVSPTMVKGMISRAYETLTCSRFRVFGSTNHTASAKIADDWSEPLTYRTDPSGASGLLPGLIHESPGGFAVEILDGFGDDMISALIQDDVHEHFGTVVCTKHPGIRPMLGTKLLNAQQVLGHFRTRTRHGEEIEVQLTQWRDGNTQHLMVTGLWDGDNLEVFFEVEGEQVRTFNVWGYPCRTAPDKTRPHQLFEEKKYERFFFKSSRDGQTQDGITLPLSDDHSERYALVLRSYIQQQATPGGDTHELNRAASSGDKLRDGDLVFVKVNSDHRQLDPNTQVIDIFPTMVGRRAYQQSPRAIAERQGVLPASLATEASAADRLFGYVSQNTDEDLGHGDVAVRGRVTVGAIDCSEATIERRTKKLVPLLSPKPSSARRFLTDMTGGTPCVSHNPTRPIKRSDYFTQGQLLGAAAYPVHRDILDAHGMPRSATVPPSQGKVNQDNDKVRLTTKAWIAAGSVLRCRISFLNLSSEELGALLWVLTPENLVPSGAKGPVGYLRMGMGKPMGLGVIEVRIAENGLRARQNRALADHYMNLTDCLRSDESVMPPEYFELRDVNSLVEMPWVKAMQRAAYGYDDNPPVRYMLLDENAANNLSDRKTGDPKPGRGLSPVALAEDAVTPIHVKPSERGER